MGLFTVFSNKEATFFIKVKAVINIVGMTYFAVMITLSITLALFISIPKLAATVDFSTTKHYLITLYLGMNTIGNYLLTVFTDTSTKTLSVKPSKSSTGKRTHRKGTKGKGKTNHVHFAQTDTVIKPWRAYDCLLCNSCILKRDHHCFFVGYCIGYHNQKYFIQCCAYITCGCFYSLILTTLYLHVNYETQFHGAWTFLYLLPLTGIQWLQGISPFGEVCMVVYLYICLTGGIVAIAFFLWESHITFHGLTTYEAMHGINVLGPKRGSVWENFVDVFGRYWYLGWILPIQLPQCGNGVYTQYAAKRH